MFLRHLLQIMFFSNLRQREGRKYITAKLLENQDLFLSRRRVLGECGVQTLADFILSIEPIGHLFCNPQRLRQLIREVALSLEAVLNTRML